MRRLSSRRLYALVATAMVALLALVGIAEATSTQTVGGAITNIRVVRSADNVSESPTVWEDIPGAAEQEFVIGAGQTVVILARFSGDSQCTSAVPGAGGACKVRLVAHIGGSLFDAVMLPSDDFTFDSVPTAKVSGFPGTVVVDDHLESHSMERSITLKAGSAGLHVTVRAQWEVDAPGTRFFLNDWSLTAERTA